MVTMPLIIERKNELATCKIADQTAITVDTSTQESTTTTTTADTVTTEDSDTEAYLTVTHAEKEDISDLPEIYSDSESEDEEDESVFGNDSDLPTTTTEDGDDDWPTVPARRHSRRNAPRFSRFYAFYISAKKGVKEFGSAAYHAIAKEFDQLYRIKKVFGYTRRTFPLMHRSFARSYS
jgi:hypothetical protein